MLSRCCLACGVLLLLLASASAFLAVRDWRCCARADRLNTTLTLILRAGFVPRPFSWECNGICVLAFQDSGCGACLLPGDIRGHLTRLNRTVYVRVYDVSTALGLQTLYNVCLGLKVNLVDIAGRLPIVLVTDGEQAVLLDENHISVESLDYAVKYFKLYKG